MIGRDAVIKISFEVTGSTGKLMSLKYVRRAMSAAVDQSSGARHVFFRLPVLRATVTVARFPWDPLITAYRVIRQRGIAV